MIGVVHPYAKLEHHWDRACQHDDRWSMVSELDRWFAGRVPPVLTWPTLVCARQIVRSRFPRPIRATATALLAHTKAMLEDDAMPFMHGQNRIGLSFLACRLAWQVTACRQGRRSITTFLPIVIPWLSGRLVPLDTGLWVKRAADLSDWQLGVVCSVLVVPPPFPRCVSDSALLRGLHTQMRRYHHQTYDWVRTFHAYAVSPSLNERMFR